MGAGSSHHFRQAQQAAQRLGADPISVLHAGNLIELLEGGVPQSFPVGEQGGQQTNLPLGEALRSPDTYKDVLANFLGAISGSTMIPEMFKAPIMNSRIP
jgi:hypothetical protein